MNHSAKLQQSTKKFVFVVKQRLIDVSMSCTMKNQMQISKNNQNSSLTLGLS